MKTEARARLQSGGSIAVTAIVVLDTICFLLHFVEALYMYTCTCRTPNLPVRSRPDNFSRCQNESSKEPVKN